MKRIEVKRVDVFTKKPFSGNPAWVVSKADGLSDDEMQKISFEMSISEAAFISSPSVEKVHFRVRFFTPTQEIPLCGHATLGACHVLAEEGKIFLREPVTTCHLETGAGIVQVEIYLKNGKVKKMMMGVSKPDFAPFEGSLEELADALRLPLDEIEQSKLPLEVVSVGLRQLMIPVKSLKTLLELSPDFSTLRRLNEQFGLASTHLFTFETEHSLSFVQTRDFSPAVGINEDPATGTANAGLGAYLVRNKALRGASPISFVAEQGRAVGRPSEVVVEVHFDDTQVKSVKVGGEAVTVMEGEIILS